MKKSELVLLFFLLSVVVVIFITAIYYLVKPSKNINFSQVQEKTKKVEKKQSITWIDKISKQNRTFSYPSVIFKVEN